MTFVNKNHFAGCLELITCLCMGLALANRGSNRILLIYLSIYMAISVAFSLSRGGTIGLFSGMFFFLIFSAFSKTGKKNIWLILGFFILAITIISLLGAEPVIKRFETLKEPELAGKARFEMWKGCLNMIDDHPLFGTGSGTFMYAYPRYQTEYMANYFVSHAHNDYLELAAETGLIGLLTVLSGIIILFISVLKKVAGTKRDQPIIGLGAISGCFSILIHAVTEFNFHIPSNAVLFAVCAAISILTTHNELKYRINISLTKKWKIFMYSVTTIFTMTALAAVLSPYIGSIYAERARAYQQAKNYDRAETNLLSASFFDYGNAEHFASMGDLMVTRSYNAENNSEKEGFLRNALKYYDSAISLCSVRGYYYTKKAFALQYMMNFKEAEETFEKALFFAPMNASLHYNLGSLYLKQGDFNPAYQKFRRSIELDATYLVIILDEISEINGDYSNLKQAVPEYPNIRRAFINYLLKKNENEAAIKESEFLFSIEPTVQNALFHLQGIWRIKEYQRAKTQGEQYVIRFSNEISLQKYMGMIYQNTGEQDKAISVYQKLLDANLKDISLYITLVNLYWREKKYSEAVNLMEKGLKFNPGEAQLHYYTGLSFRNMGNQEKALEFLKKAVFFKPGNADYLYQLGTEYKRIGIEEKAIEHWKKCIEINPKHKGCEEAVKGLNRSLGID